MGRPGRMRSARSCRPCLELQELFADATAGCTGLVAYSLLFRGLAAAAATPLGVCRSSTCVVRGCREITLSSVFVRV